jgi:hypothetical protein
MTKCPKCGSEKVFTFKDFAVGIKQCESCNTRFTDWQQSLIAEQAGTIATLTAQLAEKDKKRCEHCGSDHLVDNCLRCGAPQCCDVCCLITTLQFENSAQAKRIEELEEGLRRLVDKINLVTNSKEYISVWTLYQIHGGRYEGPSYSAEFEIAEKLIKGEVKIEANNDQPIFHSQRNAR